MTQKSVFLCSCGSSARATSTPPGFAADIVETCRREHVDNLGHREVDQREFGRIRAKQRRDEARTIQEASR